MSCLQIIFATSILNKPAASLPSYQNRYSRINAVFRPNGGFSRHTQDSSSSILQSNAKVDGGNRKSWQIGVATVKEMEDETRQPTNQEVVSEKMRQLREKIQSMLRNMDDGEISVSPYDTAWVAMVEDIGGSGRPQFPTSLEWISSNQLDDGSWGDRRFLIYDRILNTLACVVALTTWKMHPQKCNKGLRFIRENIDKLENENEEMMTVGFEVALPSLIQMAKKLGIEIPIDSPYMKKIYARRDLKLRKIPMDLLHNKPTSLLFTLEGMEGLDWEKLLNLRFEGSFLSSPSSTAYALRHTKDELCLQYLLKPVKKFNGGVPNAYPVDMFEHMWSVDRLQRLGISRYFEDEIQECLDYVYNYWTNKGICWARNTNIPDIDDTAMGFMLLRLHGYNVSVGTQLNSTASEIRNLARGNPARVGILLDLQMGILKRRYAFKNFEIAGEFDSYPGQSTLTAVTDMYDLYRASQTMFNGEHRLADAKNYSANFLHQKRLANALVDKWIISKDLPCEVGYALDVPFYASLPRLEARFFLEQYGGNDDVWIGKTLYRMRYVSCNTYLKLAKLDYRKCQLVHQLEWESIQKWYRTLNLVEFGLSERNLLLAYYIAASTAFEPEKSRQRLAWAKTTVLVETIASQRQLSPEQKGEFVDQFERGSILEDENGGRCWQKWLKTWKEGGDNLGEAEARLILHTLHLSSRLDESSFSHPKYHQLSEATGKVCHQLRLFQSRKVHHAQGGITEWISGTTFQIEAGMQEVVKLVFTKSSEDLDSLTKQSVFDIARSFYYTAYCDADAINSHMDKVLFEKIG